jgi:hypothetical protein
MGVGKILIVAGLALAGLGLLWMLGERIGLGRLPGDLVIRGKRFTFYFPIVTCLVLSLLASLILRLIHLARR